MAKKLRRAEIAEEPAPAPVATEADQEGPGRDVFFVSSDGLALHMRDYGEATSPWLPVVCLPGLTRSVRDFDDLAIFLSSHRHRPRRVVSFDYRGRGRSQWDKTIVNYNPVTEMNDVLDGMAVLGIAKAVVVGTSRGGIIATLMGVARPQMLAGLVLNDIGPVIEARGLARIKTYVGRTPPPDDWEDAVQILRRLHGAQFVAFSDADWQAFARMTFRDDNGRPVADYDPALGQTFDGVEFDRPVPALWDQFKALKAIPILVIRGENSDLLSADTVAAMATAHPRLEAIIVPGEGHAPLLRHTSLLQRISAFITGIEGAGPPADAIIPKPYVPYDLDSPPARPAEASEGAPDREP
jgi:pimeloyl-ACP methyl ester carboxylesterase